MHKRHESGSKKRKIAQEKKLKEVKVLKNVPKISNFLIASASSSNQSAPIDAEIANSSTVTSAERLDGNLDEQLSTEPFPIFSNDAALWRMDTNVEYLRAYWAKHGLFEFE